MPDAAARRRPPGRVVLAAVLAILSLSRPAVPQDVDCRSLRARIGEGAEDDRGVEQFEAALRQQAIELRRTQSYYETSGCDAGLGFGTDAAQCEAIETRIARIEANLGQLRGQVEDVRRQGGPQRRALIERYKQACLGTSTDDVSAAPDDQIMAPDPEAPPSAAAPVKALCVRHCDGGYFPIADIASPSPAALERFDSLCKALCPGTEASLYTAPSSSDLAAATAPDGSAYTALPSAFKFLKRYDATCACKPPNQSWAEALAGAEALIQADKSDVVVTQSLSDQMARPHDTKNPTMKASTMKTSTIKAPTMKPGATPRPRTATGKPAAGGTARQGQPIPSPTPAGDVAAEAGAGAEAGNPGEDLTRQFRRAAPAF